MESSTVLREDNHSGGNRDRAENPQQPPGESPNESPSLIPEREDEEKSSYEAGRYLWKGHPRGSVL